MATAADQALAVDLQPLFRKLKPGPGLPADQVHADQRRRLHGATITLVDAEAGMGVRPLARVAGVSTSTFYRHFANVEDCLASTYDSVTATAVRRASAAAGRQPEWRAALQAAVDELMELFAREPRAARFALVDVFAAGPGTRKRIGQNVSELEAVFSTAFARAPRQIVPPRHLITGMTAGMLRVSRTTILAGRADELPGLSDQIGEWMASFPGEAVLSLRTGPGGLESDARREQNPFPAGGPTSAFLSDVTSARSRLLAAALKLASVDGPARMAAPRLRKDAGVTRRLFDTTFDGVEHCFLEAVEVMVGRAAVEAQAWGDEAGDWKRTTCLSTLALCAQAARNRTWARLIFLGTLATGRTGLLRRERMIGEAARRLRSTTPPAVRPSPVAAEASVAAGWQIAQTDIAARRSAALPKLAPLISYFLLAPSVGAEGACRSIRESLVREPLTEVRQAPCN